MIEFHVPTPLTCVRLHDAGFPQNTMYFWANEEDVIQASHFGDVDGSVLLHRDLINDLKPTDDSVAAPILTEILEQLLVGMVTVTRHEQHRWMVAPYDEILRAWVAPTSVEAAAHLWLKLKEADA